MEDPTVVRLASPDDPTVIVDDSVGRRHAASREATVIVGPWVERTGADPTAPTQVLSPAGSGQSSGQSAPSAGGAQEPRAVATEAPTVVLDNAAKAGAVSAARASSGTGSGEAPASVPARGHDRDDRHESTATPPGVRYVVVGTAGKGGMGVVHVARDVGLLRRVALKELSSSAAHDDDARARFVREVQVTAQLDHPHIVPVYSLEVADDDRPAYAMKLVEGRTFVQMIATARAIEERGEVPDEAHALHTRLEHFLKVCDAVGYAHARGVVHRDLKPANLMIGAHNEVYVMDWGLCRLLSAQARGEDEPVTAARAGGDGSETVVGTIVGTPRYMSPEQARGENATLDARSDQYSLGAILFELVTLRPPIAGRDALEILGRAAQGHHEPVAHAFGAAIPAELVAIVGKALAKDPRDRYASVTALADDVRRFMRGEAVQARPDSPWQRVVRQLARHRQTVAIAMLGFVVLSLLTTLGLLWRHERALARERLLQQRYEAFVAEAATLGDAIQLYLLDMRDDLNTLTAAMALAAQWAEPDPRQPLWAAAGQPLPDGADRGGVFVRFPGDGPAAQELQARRLMHADTSRLALLSGLARAFGDRRPRAASTATAWGSVELRAGFASGLLYVFPATLHSTGLHDHRTAAWYRHALDSKGLSWSVLADDGDEDVNDTQLAITAPILDDTGRALGAVGLILALDAVLTHLVPDCGVASAAATALVEPGGRVLASCDADGRVTAADLGLFSTPELLRAIEAGDTGSVELDGATTMVAAFDRVHPLGWSLVRAMPRERLLGSGEMRR